jgi:hypothetical protein
LEKIPYRLCLEGFIKKENGAMTLFVRDRETGQLELVAEGTASREGDFFVERCDFRTGPEGAVRTVLLRDGRDGRRRRLPLDGSIPAERFHIEILSNRYGLQELHSFHGLGEKIAHGGRFYELAGAEPASGTVHLSPSEFPERAFYLQLSAGGMEEEKDPAGFCAL